MGRVCEQDHRASEYPAAIPNSSAQLTDRWMSKCVCVVLGGQR